MSSLTMKITVMVGQEECEFECEVDFHYTAGSHAYFSQSFGNWLPGDPPEVDVTSIKRVSDGLSFEFEDLGEYMQDRIVDRCIEHAESEVPDYAEPSDD